MKTNYSNLCILFLASPGSLGGVGVEGFYKTSKNIIRKDIEYKSVAYMCKIFPPLKDAKHTLHGEEFITPGLFWHDWDIIDKCWHYYYLGGGATYLFVRDCYNDMIKECLKNLDTFSVNGLLDSITDALVEREKLLLIKE